jgi:hypothetical protein
MQASTYNPGTAGPSRDATTQGYSAPQLGPASLVSAQGYQAPNLGNSQGYAAARVGTPIGAQATNAQASDAQAGSLLDNFSA